MGACSYGDVSKYDSNYTITYGPNSVWTWILFDLHFVFHKYIILAYFGWWFGTLFFIVFPNLESSSHLTFHIFQRGRVQLPTSINMFYTYVSYERNSTAQILSGFRFRRSHRQVDDRGPVDLVMGAWDGMKMHDSFMASGND